MIENDADYLCDSLVSVGYRIGVVILALLLAAVFLKTSYLVNFNAFDRDHIILAFRFTQITRWWAFMVALLVYLRIRLTIDMAKDRVPIYAHEQRLLTLTRGDCILQSLIYLIVGVACIWASDYVVLVFHNAVRNNVFLLLVPMVLQIGGPGAGGAAIVAGSLLLEKSVLFFPRLLQDLRSIAELHGQSKKVE